MDRKQRSNESKERSLVTQPLRMAKHIHRGESAREWSRAHVEGVPMLFILAQKVNVSRISSLP